MDWIVKKGDRVLVPPVDGRINSATVTRVLGVLGKRLMVEVVVDCCEWPELYGLDQLARMEKQ